MKTNLPGKIAAFLMPAFFSSCKKYLGRNVVLSIAFLPGSYGLFASPSAYPASYTPEDMLMNLLSGKWDAKHHAVKWNATPGDVHEFNGALSEQPIVYSVIDTTFVISRGAEILYYVVFSTAPMMTSEDGEFVNANSCHVCGVNLGYYTYTKENDSIYLHKFKRNFATHGSFGTRSYSLSLVNLGDGYELLKVDDPYEGMGTTSVATRFYDEGELILSMISKENNRGNRDKGEKGYYQFNTAFIYDPEMHAITAKQTGYRIDEKSGKRIGTNKTRKMIYDSYTLQF